MSRAATVAGLLVAALAAAGPVRATAGTGAPRPDVATAATTAAIAVVDDRGRRVVLRAPPARIVSLLPSVTESVCALGACDRLVGVDRSSDWPASIAALPRLGGLEDTSVERIAALRPQLVLAPMASRVVDRLESLGLVVVVLEPRSFADTRRVLDVLARALGRPADGEALWRRIESRVDAAAARVPAAARGARVYVEVSPVPHAAGEASFVGETLARLGLASVVPAALGPFPQLSPEFVVRAAPDVIVAPAHALDGMAARPGFAALGALRAGRACGLSPERLDLVMRPGPRLGEAAETLADCVAALPPR